MDTVLDKPVRRFRLVRWLRDKVENRRTQNGESDPWWVTLLLDVGRPAVAVMILTMCAPGEHYLGVKAGFQGMAWLTPASLTAYAGISAVVATKRPKGAPGRKTAIWGAVLSILIAMAAQPIAHLYEQHLITGYRPALTITVSVIPAAVFGHLLHMGAAAPKVRRTRPAVKPDTDTPPLVRVDIEEAAPAGQPDILSAFLTGRTAGLAPSVPDKPRTVPDRPVLLSDKQGLSARALVLASGGQDRDTIKDTLRTEFPDAKADSVRKAADRAVDKVSAAS
jgi:hypothetical protein